MEIWKDVKNYEGLYQVSNYGRIKGQHGQILKQSINTNGYPYLNLCDKNHIRKNTRVHRVVAEAFVENPHKHNVINHIDGNKNNNNVYNLEWCTQSYNIKHSFIIGTNNKISQYKQIQKINPITKEIIQTYDSISLAVRDMNIDNWQIIKGVVSNIGRCAKGKTKTAYGYKWRYL